MQKGNREEDSTNPRKKKGEEKKKRVGGRLVTGKRGPQQSWLIFQSTLPFHLNLE